MKKGQLLSIDALLSLVIVVMVVGVVMNTNDMIKAEITNLLDWYDRANIANNMLDVLTKRPGYPEDWESNVSSVKMVGLRDKKYPFALSYEKIIALNRSKEEFKDIFNQLARGKDFLLEVYISNITLNISGRFPRVYLDNITFANPRGNPPGVNLDITNKTGDNPDSDNGEFRVSYIEIRNLNGATYVNEAICDLPDLTGNNLQLNPETGIYYLKVITVDPVWIKAKRGQGYIEPSPLYLPPGTVLEVHMNDLTQSNFKITFVNCPFIFKFTGQGNVFITISGYDSTFPTLNFTYESARNLFDLDKPLYRIAMINGTFESDMNKIKSSMDRSPWTEPVYRVFPVTKFIYNLSSGPSKEEPILYGYYKEYGTKNVIVKIKVNSTLNGNMTLIGASEKGLRGIFVYGNSTDLSASLVWYENNEPKLKRYHGENGTIAVPFEDLFPLENTKSKLISLWFYSLEGWSREDVSIEFVPDIKPFLEPEFDETLIRLVVWDDR
ncbi:hypothetical protein NF865_01845 [Thermococcus aggregans]|uniref:Uncharacterized protein n=1 Tax=Thermococcus aggregans TaxID=110163 RepID=A0A9E7MY78_THEAG|nr:hypothetical protein [Thermococcus aggregans]USS40987.1 hypothetical protein NF865_01845 [Thermococcus aggregans]